MVKVLAAVNLKMIKVVLASFIILLLLLLAISGCQTREAESTHLKVVTLPYITFATFYIPQEEGYFAEQGLEVEFVKFPTVPQAMPLLAEGSLDVVAGPVSASLINGIAQNMKFRIVAGREYVPPVGENLSLMVRKDLYESGELDTVAKMKGKKVAIASVGSLTDFGLAKILETANLTLKDVAITIMPPQNTVAAFENRAIDAAIVGQPQLEQLKTLGYAVTLESLNNLMPGFEQGFVIFGPSLLDDKVDLGKKFIVAYLQGCRQYAQGKTTRNVEILEKYTGMDEKIILQSYWAPIYTDGRINVADILYFQDWLYDSGLVDKKVSSEQLIDTTFIDYANGVLGPAQ